MKSTKLLSRVELISKIKNLKKNYWRTVINKNATFIAGVRIDPQTGTAIPALEMKPLEIINKMDSLTWHFNHYIELWLHRNDKQNPPRAAIRIEPRSFQLMEDLYKCYIRLAYKSEMKYGLRPFVSKLNVSNWFIANKLIVNVSSTAEPEEKVKVAIVEFDDVKNEYALKVEEVPRYKLFLSEGEKADDVLRLSKFNPYNVKGHYLFYPVDTAKPALHYMFNQEILQSYKQWSKKQAFEDYINTALSQMI